MRHLMTITISKRRRLVYYGYGWKIERKRKKKTKRGEWWKEDRPAYPASIERALNMCLERELADAGDCDISELAERIEAASKTLLNIRQQLDKGIVHNQKASS